MDGQCYDTAAGSDVLKDGSVDFYPLGNEHGVICTRPHSSARERALWRGCDARHRRCNLVNAQEQQWPLWIGEILIWTILSD